MKKTRKALLAVLACSVALAGAAGLAACSGGSDESHEHTWGDWTVSTQPTEEATGKATRACSGEGTCDAKATEKEATLPALTSTDYTKGEDNATCSAEGTVTYTYDKDGVSVSFDVATPKKAHTEEVLQGKAATCSEAGLSDGKKCSVCGEITVAQTPIAAHHSEIILTQKYPNCTEDGLTEGKKCSVCGEITVPQVKIDALGHVESTLPEVEATCSEDGLTEGKKCAVCQTVLEAQEVVAATGHTLSTTTPTHVPKEGEDATGGTVSQRCTVCNKAIVYEYDNAVLDADGAQAAKASALSVGVNYVTQSTANPYLGYEISEAGTYSIYWLGLNNSTFNLSTATFGTTSTAFINSNKQFMKANIPEGLVIEGHDTSDLQYYIDNESVIAKAGEHVKLTKDNLSSSQNFISLASFVPSKLTFTITQAQLDAATDNKISLKFRTVTSSMGGCFLIGINKEPAIVGEYCTIGAGNFTIKDTELEFMPVTEQGAYTFKAATGKFQVYVNDNLYSDDTKSSFGYVGFCDRYLTVTLQQGDVVKVVKCSTKASENKITIVEGTEEEPAVPERNTLEVGDNNITLSTTNVSIGKYEDGTEKFYAFTAAESGYYEISVADDVKVSVSRRVDKTHYTFVFDVGNMNKHSGVFYAEAGEAVLLAFVGNETEEFAVNIVSCDEPVTYLNANEKLENVTFSGFESILKLTVGDSVAEGTYELTFKVSPSLLRSYIYFSVNDEIEVEDAYDSATVNAYATADISKGAYNTVGAGTKSKGVNKGDYSDEQEYADYIEYLDYTRTITVKAGDVIYLATTAVVSGAVDITLTPVE